MQVLGVHDHGSHDHDSHDHGPEGEDMKFVWQMSVVFGGMYCVFAIENFLKAMKRWRSQSEVINRNKILEILQNNTNYYVSLG